MEPIRANVSNMDGCVDGEIARGRYDKGNKGTYVLT